MGRFKKICATAGALALAAPAGLAAPVFVADIIEFDDLGYECIDEKYLDEGDGSVAAVAFRLSGKTRLPRTCLPEPCARALTRAELSRLTGTEQILPRFESEWEEYYARYADYCRKETNPDSDPDEVSSRSGGFWTPILARASNPSLTSTTTPTTIVPLIVSSGGSNTTTGGGSSGGGSSGGGESTGGGTAGSGGSGGNTPSPVPLPGTLALLLSALGLSAVFRRKIS